MFSLVPWILMTAHVPPRPTVKAAILHVCDVVGNDVVSQAIAFVGGTPQVARLWLNRKSYRIADAGCVNTHPRAVRVELKNVGSIFRSEEHTSELQSPDHLVCR